MPEPRMQRRTSQYGIVIVHSTDKRLGDEEMRPTTATQKTWLAGAFATEGSW